MNGPTPMLFDPTDLPEPPSKGPPRDRPPSRVKEQSVDEARKEKVERRLVRRYANCADTVGEIRKGMILHVVSMADWSAHDLVIHCTDYTGPAELWFATWSISETPVRKLVMARDAGKFTALHGVVDWRVTVRMPEAVQLLKAQGDRLGVYPLHSKIYLLRNAEWGITIISSANFTENPRVEASVLTEDPEITDWHAEWIDALLRKAKPFGSDQGKEPNE